MAKYYCNYFNYVTSEERRGNNFPPYAIIPGIKHHSVISSEAFFLMYIMERTLSNIITIAISLSIRNSYIITYHITPYWLYNTSFTSSIVDNPTFLIFANLILL